MEAIGTNCHCSTIQNEQKNEKQQVAIEKVQTEFLKQIAQGNSEVAAFKNAIRTLDEKYNPQEDTFNVGCCSYDIDNMSETYLCAKSMKLPSRASVLSWLNFIAEVIPLIYKIFDMIPKKEPKPEIEPTSTPIPPSAPDVNVDRLEKVVENL